MKSILIKRVNGGNKEAPERRGARPPPKQPRPYLPARHPEKSSENVNFSSRQEAAMITFSREYTQLRECRGAAAAGFVAPSVPRSCQLPPSR